MKINLVRRGAWIGLAAIALLSSVPVLSASTAGAIELTRVGDSGTPFVRGPADIQWNWQAGTDVRFSTVMSLEVFNSAGARVLHRYRYVRYGQWPWDTRKVADGVYTARATVRNHPEISSVLTPIYVDNTAPTVEITSPARGAKSVYVQDVAYGFDKTVVVGATTVAADVADNFSGVGQVEWFLDGVKIELDDDKYDFSAVAPGEHTLSVIATDLAGNQNKLTEASEISIIAVGVGGAPTAPEPPDLGEQPDPNEILPSGDPTAPDPSEILPSGDPTVPDPSEILPSEDPTVPNPDPSQTPDPGTLLPVPPPAI